MSKLECTCGNLISDSISPNEVTGEILSHKGGLDYLCSGERIINEFIHHFDAGTIGEWRKKNFNEHYLEKCSPGQMVGDALSHLFSGLVLNMLECDVCGRLWIERKNGSNVYSSYAPDDQANRVKVLGLNTPKQAEQD